MSDPFVIRPQSPVVDRKKWGRTDLPDGKVNSIAELEHDEVTKLIELMGTRLVWSRMAFCPCAEVNDETQQPDPNCTKCRGRRAFHFGPRDYAAPDQVGTLTTLQRAIQADDGGAIIRGLVQRSQNVQDANDKLGNWVRGEMYVSVRWENLIGYYDRLTAIDATIAYSEVITLTGTVTVPLRYRAVQVNVIESVDRRYDMDVDYEVTADGKVRWIIDPPSGRVSVHYVMHPTFLVAEHPHVLRATPRRKKKPGLYGEPQPQPIQAMIQLEFLPKDARTA